jgi:glycosyltransferase involved in cell wall biosynthesis
VVDEKQKSMNTGSSRIAVIVPAYNASAFIADTIKSILGQSRLADEIVLVDDGSTDDTAAVAARVSDKVTIVRQKNVGTAGARQRGVEATTAELLLFLDADDILHASALEKLSAVLRCQPLAAIAYCPAEVWLPMDQGRTHIDTLPRPRGENPWETLLYSNFICTPGCVLMRRSALNEVGGWDTSKNMKANEDWDLWLRLAEKKSFALVTEPLVKYRMHGASLSKNRRVMIKSMFVVFGKQRSRWKHNSSRRLAVEAGEWHNCKYVIREMLRAARSSCSNGQIIMATTLVMEVLLMGSRPTLSHFFNVVKRRFFPWRRMSCGKPRQAEIHERGT